MFSRSIQPSSQGGRCGKDILFQQGVFHLENNHPLFCKCVHHQENLLLQFFFIIFGGPYVWRYFDGLCVSYFQSITQKCFFCNVEKSNSLIHNVFRSLRGRGNYFELRLSIFVHWGSLVEGKATNYIVSPYGAT